MSRVDAFAPAERDELLMHDALVYGGDEELVTATLPFIREGLAIGERSMVAVKDASVAVLQRALGRDSERVDWVEDADSHTPLRRLGLFRRYVADRVERGDARVRLIGEPVWPTESQAGIAEWKRYESFLNLALASDPVWLVCHYDARQLPATIVTDAQRTHPHVGYGAGRGPSGRYVHPSEFAGGLDRQPLPEPPAGTVPWVFDTVAQTRRFVAERAREAGLSEARVEDLKLATSEVATNAARHAGSPAEVRTWTSPPAFVCELRDGGPGFEDPFAGYVPPESGRAGGWGLAVARQVCDVVEIRAGGAGTTVRLHMRLD
jgi:anti-sigma regulatory factor (Ser/Thr protein kinase)